MKYINAFWFAIYFICFTFISSSVLMVCEVNFLNVFFADFLLWAYFFTHTNYFLDPVSEFSYNFLKKIF